MTFGAKKAFASALLLALAACGGSGEGDVTHISGAVVKGPVANARVCAFAVTAGAKGAPLGDCVTTDATGAYALDLPVTEGLVILETQGGSYVDETSGATVSLAGLPALRTLAEAQGGRVTAMATPLTTLALNAALAAGPLSAAGFSSHAAGVLAAFGLPATLDIVATSPSFGAAPNAYAQALIVISRMVANGTPLATLLAAADPASLASAYASAAASSSSSSSSSGSCGGGGSSGPATGPTASGTLSVAGGPVSSFSPQANGFEVHVDAEGVKYRFYRDNQRTDATGTLTLTAYLEIELDAAGQVRKLVYNDPQTILQAPELCASGCDAGLSFETPPPGASHPVTVRLSGVRIGAATLDGTLVGNAPDALWRVSDLPRSTAGSVGTDNVERPILKADYEVSTSGGMTQRTATVTLDDGAEVRVQAFDGGASTVSYQKGASSQFCFSNCAASITDNGGHARVAFNGVSLSGGMVLSRTVDIVKTGGTLSSATLGNFTATASSVSALNDERTYSFQGTGTPAGGISQVSVTLRRGTVTAMSVGGAGGFFSCFEAAQPLFGAPACSGVNLEADRRTLSFTNVPLGNRNATATISGTLSAKGL